jgi:integrase
MISFVSLAIETALRRGELLDLCWSRIDWTASTAHIPQTKTGRPRTIPLTPTALRLLQRLPREAEKVFPFSANSAKLAWVYATKRAGIVGLRFHDLRHEAISRLFEMELSMPEVALISGHRDARMLLRYTHLDAITLAKRLKERADAD